MHLILISAVITAGAVAGCLLGEVSAWFVLPIAVALHVPLVIGVFHTTGSLVCPTITRGRSDRHKLVALTFDDGPSPHNTPAVLDLLAQRKVLATFFVTGKAVRRCPALTRAIASAGHELGNHSYLHPRHVYLWSRSTLRRDVSAGQRAIEKAAGVSPTLYRPPVGFRSIAMARVMRELGLRLVNFSARAYDTRPIDAPTIVRRIRRGIRPGAIILLHDGADRDMAPDRRALLEALPLLIDGLQRDGYRFVPVSELI